jgi:transaldolase/glucose-6-phosphate isomerase
MDAFRDHGEVTADIIEQDEEGARAVLVALHEHGISLNRVTQELLEEGVQQFSDAFDQMFDAIARRRYTLLEATAHSESLRRKTGR